MQKWTIVFALFLTIAFAASCGDSVKCDPACATGKVCIQHDGHYACALKCTTDEDCKKASTGKDGLVCHKDHATPHCGEKEGS